MKTKITNRYNFLLGMLILLAVLQATLYKGFLPSNKNQPGENINSLMSLNLTDHYSVHKNLNFKEINSTLKNYRQNASNEIVVTFTETPTTFNVSKAPLKYNKHFAYSLTLDDGKENALTAAYPLFAGGFSSETGQTYPGLYYTDGCGNKIEFRAGIAVGSVNPSGDDTHLGTPGILTWDQVKEMYNKNWDVFNHGYAHKAGPGTNYDYEVRTNATYIKTKTGIDLKHFVIPSGDAEYTEYAFNAGMKGVYNQSGDFPGSQGLLVNAPLSVNKFKLYRQFLNDDDYTQTAGKVDVVANKSSDAERYWYSEFTHHVSVSQQGGSLLFPTFKTHMEKLENSYGYKGNDKIWMAPLQEVYEYLSMRENTSLTNTIDNKKGIIAINLSQVPTDLRRYTMTFVIDTEKEFTNVECPGASKITFKGTGNNKLINIEWPQNPLTITGILDPVKSDFAMINAYPNPVDNYMTLSLPDMNMQEVEVSIYNENGLDVYSGSQMVINEKTVLNLSTTNFVKGIYIIKVKSKTGQIQIGKFLKN